MEMTVAAGRSGPAGVRRPGVPVGSPGLQPIEIPSLAGCVADGMLAEAPASCHGIPAARTFRGGAGESGSAS